MQPGNNDYLQTIWRMEPNIVPIDAAGGWASIAISLKRIADTLEILVERATVREP